MTTLQRIAAAALAAILGTGIYQAGQAAVLRRQVQKPYLCEGKGKCA
jgi:hypothetical protein